MSSGYVCRRCGLPVHLYREDQGHRNVWKHGANGKQTSCHKLPDVVTVDEYAALHKAMRKRARGLK